MSSFLSKNLLITSAAFITISGAMLLSGCWKKDEKTAEPVKTEILSLFGAPGCGKGTMSSSLIKELKYESLSTGDLCRKHIQEQTEQGKELKKYVDAGQLAPDDLITGMVMDWLKERAGKVANIILDGYPRTKAQAESFLKALHEKPEFKDITFRIVNFNVPDEEIVKRISNRIVCSNKSCQKVYSLLVNKPAKEGICDACGAELIKRADDSAEVVADRLKVFAQFKDELLNFYKESEVEILDFTPTGESVEKDFADLKKVLNK
jgi:adenylate kinase